MNVTYDKSVQTVLYHNICFEVFNNCNKQLNRTLPNNKHESIQYFSVYSKILMQKEFFVYGILYQSMQKQNSKLKSLKAAKLDKK